MENEKILLEDMIFEAGKMIEKQTEVIKEIERLQSNLESKLAEFNPKSAWNLVQNMNDVEYLNKEILETERAIRSGITDLYNSLFELKTSHKLFEQSVEDEFIISKYDDIQVKDMNGSVLIKLPMLLPKINKNTKRYMANNYPVLYDHFFEKELFDEIIGGKIERKSKFWKIENKLIHFVFVYGKDHNGILDTDSHDTKKIIDVITCDMKFGDSGLTTSVLYETIYDENYGNNTLIFVSDIEKNILKKEQILELAKETF